MIISILQLLSVYKWQQLFTNGDKPLNFSNRKVIPSLN